jgi:lipid-A-disaccharide synthase
MRSLKSKAPHVKFIGCGGPLMEQEGLVSLFPIDRFAVIGPVAALKVLPAALQSANALAEAAKAQGADAAILIDSWAFSKIAAERIKKYSPQTRLIKYVAPQVWASRPERADTLASLFEGLLTLFEFELPFFERKDLAVRFVGNSTFQEAMQGRADGSVFRAKHKLEDAPLLAVLPGSRKPEIARLGKIFGETIGLLHKEHPKLRIAVAAAPAVEEEVRTLCANWPGEPVIVSSDERYGVFAAADAALAASGTVTTELAINGTPMVVGYKLEPLSAMWVRMVATTAFVSLINIAAGKMVIPEFLQEDCRPENLAAALAPLLSGGPEARAQKEAFPPLLDRLGAGGAPASKAAAAAVLEWIRRN